MSETVTLHCQLGNHSWERPKQRGKRPFNCPEHAPEKPTTGLSRDESLAHARQTRASAASEQLEWERKNLYPHVKENDGNYANEASDVLNFIDERIPFYIERKARGGEESAKEIDSDIKMLQEQRDRILKRVRSIYGENAADPRAKRFAPDLTETA